MVLFVPSISKLASAANQSVRVLFRNNGFLFYEIRTQSTFTGKSGLQGFVRINKSMSLRLCNRQSESIMNSKNSSNSSNNNNNLTNNSNHVDNNNDTQSKRLAIIMSWMLAKDKHIEKYRKMYFKRGFDVLTVQTSPMDLLLPKSGSQKVADNLLEYLKSQISNYPNMIVHGFSVGAYQWGEMLLRMKSELETRNVNAQCEALRNNLKGVIFDSAVDLEGVPYGLSRAMFRKSVLAPITEQFLRGYMKLFYYVSTQHYRNASRAFYDSPLRCPALLLVSNEDKLGNPAANERVAKHWKEIGINVSWKCWDDSDHVLHFQKYPSDYENEMDAFLDKIDIYRK